MTEEKTFSKRKKKFLTQICVTRTVKKKKNLSHIANFEIIFYITSKTCNFNKLHIAKMLSSALVSN